MCVCVCVCVCSFVACWKAMPGVSHTINTRHVAESNSGEDGRDEVSANAICFQFALHGADVLREFRA